MKDEKPAFDFSNFNLEDTILAAASAQGIEIPDEKVDEEKVQEENKEIVEVAKEISTQPQKAVKEEKVEKRQKDMPSRLNARRKMMKKINKVKDSNGNNVDLLDKLFNEIAPKYAGKNVGGYTRIVKAGPRRGDGAEVAILQLI